MVFLAELHGNTLGRNRNGTDIAEDILLKAGARIVEGVIYAPKKWDISNVTYGDIFDAQDFLCDEFDYAVVLNSETLENVEQFKLAGQKQ